MKIIYTQDKIKKLGYKLAVDPTFSIIFKIERPKHMMQAVPIKSFDSEIIFDSEESFQLNRLEDSFLDEVLEKKFEEDS